MAKKRIEELDNAIYEELKQVIRIIKSNDKYKDLNLTELDITYEMKRIMNYM